MRERREKAEQRKKENQAKSAIVETVKAIDRLRRSIDFVADLKCKDVKENDEEQETKQTSDETLGPSFNACPNQLEVSITIDRSNHWFQSRQTLRMMDRSDWARLLRLCRCSDQRRRANETLLLSLLSNSTHFVLDRVVKTIQIHRCALQRATTHNGDENASFVSCPFIETD